MKKLFLLISVLILLGFGVYWFNKNTQTANEDKPTIKIGVSLPMTGEAAYIGDPSKFAAQMALDKWKAKDTKYNYELVFEDDQLSTRVSSIAANKMISVDKVRAILTIWDVASPVNMEIAKRNNIIHIGCTWGDNMSDGVHNFNNTSSGKQHASKMLELFKKQNVKKVGYVAQVVRGDLDLKNYLIKDFKKNGIEVVFEEEFHIGNKDFRTFFSKIKDKPVDIMIVTMLPDDFSVFVKQKKEAGNETPITSVDYFESIENKELAEGSYYVISSPGNDEFIKDISKHTDVIGQCIANINADVDVLIYAFENAKAEDGQIPTTEEVVKVLHTIKNYDSVLGKISIEEDGHIDSPAILRKIENGKSVAGE